MDYCGKKGGRARREKKGDDIEDQPFWHIQIQICLGKPHLCPAICINPTVLSGFELTLVYKSGVIREITSRERASSQRQGSPSAIASSPGSTHLENDVDSFGLSAESIWEVVAISVNSDERR